MDLPARLHLAHLPTPIHKLERLSGELGCNLYVWRDDLSGFELGGNKIRKLEFELAEALRRGASAVVTCGGVQSNHVRATVFAARRVGLAPHVVLREPPGGAEPGELWTGNLLLDRLAGAHLRFVPFEEYDRAGRSYEPFLAQEEERLRAGGETPYLIGEGASSALGSMGYVQAVEELLATWGTCGPGTAAPDSLFTALGSGGTFAGLLLGYRRHGLDPRSVHAVNVCNDRGYFEGRVGALLAGGAELLGTTWEEIPLEIHDGYVGRGYARASDEELRFYARIARLEGLLLDPCYTGKAFRGMVAEIGANPGRFGRDILFLHSGGAWANSAYAEQFCRALEQEEDGRSR